ncbi:hypothetical protein GGR08_001570 [Bartonella fuyuanensis]|uniref:Uncharacterized protein n=1 Tax=Bartonella fuyuanensis TaxID=1460968 RepID=A0A840E0F9_9HYPH|nr:hypothetical protein [Bartonella fuyuanensis]MBB4077242.1 hypothetical protein [Bartonella fuyuanensis]
MRESCVIRNFPSIQINILSSDYRIHDEAIPKFGSDDDYYHHEYYDEAM